eukprot:COSAG01_NODE_1328_length_10708_cov_102.064379_2_plen_178_part_00
MRSFMVKTMPKLILQKRSSMSVTLISPERRNGKPRQTQNTRPASSTDHLSQRPCPPSGFLDKDRSSDCDFPTLLLGSSLVLITIRGRQDQAQHRRFPRSKPPPPQPTPRKEITAPSHPACQPLARVVGPLHLSKNGYLSRRSGGHNRWHSPVNCNFGDSTGSRVGLTMSWRPSPLRA